MQDILEKMEKLDTEVKELRKEIMDLLSSIPEDTRSFQHTVVPQVEVWDTGKAWEQEYRLYPDPTRKVTGCLKNLRQGKSIAVVYTLCTY